VATADQLTAYERQFRRAGLPLFVEDFSGSTDVFNRAAPLLGVVFIGELLGAIQLDWAWWQNVLAVLGGVAFLLAGLAAINLIQGRPLSAIPNRLGKAELAGFVILPALLPLIFGGQAGSAAVTIAANLAILAVIYAVFVYGLLAILRWVLGRLAGQLASSLGLLAKAVPLLAIFALLSFTTEEMWDIFAQIGDFAYAAVIGLFVVLGTAFLSVRVPRETRRLEREAAVEGPPLRRAQRVNVGLVLFVSQAVQVLIVGLDRRLLRRLRDAGDRRDGADRMDGRYRQRAALDLDRRRELSAHRGAAAGGGRVGGVLGVLLRRRDADRLDLS
jgi:hypothetical protein